MENINIDYSKFNDINVRNQYQEEVSQLLAAAPPATNNQERWNNKIQDSIIYFTIVNIYKNKCNIA